MAGVVVADFGLVAVEVLFGLFGDGGEVFVVGGHGCWGEAAELRSCDCAEVSCLWLDALRVGFKIECSVSGLWLGVCLVREEL